MHVTDKSARLMVLVDGENFHAQHAEALLKHVRSLGALVDVRVYGHLTNPAMPEWEKACKQYRFALIPTEIAGRNSTDFQITIEAIDILHMRQLDALCIASSDADFTSLARRIKAGTMRVYGVGENKAPKSYRKAFDRFMEVPTASKARKQQSGSSDNVLPVAVNPTRPAGRSPAGPLQRHGT
jgi:hypothetical protein